MFPSIKCKGEIIERRIQAYANASDSSGYICARILILSARYSSSLYYYEKCLTTCSTDRTVEFVFGGGEIPDVYLITVTRAII